MVLVSGSLALADSRWLDDTLIDYDTPGLERVCLDVKEDNSAWYALVSGDQIGDPFGWYRSADAGASWSEIFGNTWVVANVAIGGAYGFDLLMEVWQPYLSLWYRTYDPDTGDILSSATFAHEAPREAREIVVDSNAESGPGTVFIAVALLVDPGTGQATLKAYRTADLGSTWTDFTVLDQGPAGHPDFIGDIDLTFDINAYPFFHVVYRKSGRIWHVRTDDAGVTWDTPTELIVNVAATSEVSVAFNAIYGIAVGESMSGQVVYCYSDDLGASWSNAMLIDTEEPVARLPSACVNFGPWTVVYRKANGRLAVRSSSNPGSPAYWTDEEYASIGTTNHPIATCMSSYPDGNTGVVYIRADDSGRPYFASESGPSSVDEPVSVTPGSLVAYPSPSAGTVTVLLGESADLAGTEQATGYVVDAVGRVVARLEEASGSHLRWDGRDALGRVVANGKYHIHVGTQAGMRSAPVVILR
jgi:hypothetical protein